MATSAPCTTSGPLEVRDFIRRLPRENLLVLYLPDERAHEALLQRMRSHGHAPGPPGNPYWEDIGVTFADPDGWRVVIAPTKGIQVK